METNTLTENGVSTTKGLGEEMYIKCCLGAQRFQCGLQVGKHGLRNVR